MFLQSTLYLVLLTSPIWAKPEGFYHQEYQYKQSQASYKNDELQHKKDDEGFYTKDGDLTGTQDPKVNEQHAHTEFLNPKLRAQGYSERDFAAGSGMDMHGRTEQFLGGAAYDQFGAASSGSSYKQNALQSGTTLSSGMQSFMANLQYDMQRQLERQLQQWRQDQEEYSSAVAQNSQNRYSSTSSGLYSPSTASADSIRRELQEEIRANLTREIDLRNRIAQTQYDSSDLNDIKQQMQTNLMKQLNMLMQQQQGRTGTQQMYPSNAYNTQHQSSSSSNSIKTKSVTTKTNTPTVVPTGTQHSSYEQDDLNRNQQYQQQRYNPDRSSSSTPVITPGQYVYVPSGSSASRSASMYGSTMHGSSMHGGSTSYENPTPVIRNVNQIMDIAQQVQTDMQKVLIQALERYQQEHSFNPSNKYQTKPDYQYARQDLESRLQYNLTELFQNVLHRNFGEQDMRGQYYFSRGADANQQQRYANYKVEDYERLKQEVNANLQKFLMDSLKSQEEYYQTQQRAYSASSQSAASYTSGTQYSSGVPHQEGYYTSKPTTYGQGGSSSYSSSSSYSGSAAYQSESRPQRTGGSYTKTYNPTGGYRGTSDTTMYGTFAKYQGRGDQQSVAGQSGVLEDCDEGMQGDDPRAGDIRSEFDSFGVEQKPIQNVFASYQKPVSYSYALRKPATSEENYQRPVSDFQDFESPVSDLEAYQRPVSNLEAYQRPVSHAEAFQRPVSNLEEFERPSSNVRYYQPRSNLGRPYSRFYDSERNLNYGRSGNRGAYLNTPKVGQFAVDADDYDDDIKQNEKVLQLDDDQSNVHIEIEDTPIKNEGNSFHFNSMVLKPTTESMENLNNAKIDEIAQKLKDSVGEFHYNMQQQTLDDNEQFEENGKSSANIKPTDFSNFYGSTEKIFENQNENLLRVVKPYNPQTIEMLFSSTPKYDDQSSDSYNNPIPKYDYFNPRPIYTYQFSLGTTSTEAPMINYDLGDPDLQHHLHDSYEEMKVYNKPFYVKPKVEGQYVQNNRRIDGVLSKPRGQNQISQEKMTQQVVDGNKKPTVFPEDEEFLQNVLREPKASNRDGDEEDAEDLGQKPVDDNQEVVISSHRGDIDSFAKPNSNRKPMESNQGLPIRLADISSQQNPIGPNQNVNLNDENNYDTDLDDVQKPLAFDSIYPESPSVLYRDAPERLSHIRRAQNLNGGYSQLNLNKINDEEELDDLQRPIEEPIDQQKPIFDDDLYSDDLQHPIDEPIELQQHSELNPIRMISAPSYGYGPKPIYNENQYSDDVQRPMEDLDELQRPIDGFDDVQKPVQLQNYEDYDQEINHAPNSRSNQGLNHHKQGEGRNLFVQNGHRIPEIYESLTEDPKDEVHENEIRRQHVKPTYLNSEYNTNDEQRDIVGHVHNSTDIQNNAGFWKKFGGKISNTYSSAKQKAREMVEKMKLL